MPEESGERKPKLYEIFQGEVASLQAYGAFVKIPNSRKQGLVHKSQMSNARVEDPSEMLAKGEKVFCKIIAMMEDGDKISLSMKVVNQTTGQDLDPNNVQSSQDEKKRRQWNFKENNRIELGAELNTTCRRCGGHGHLTMDCFVGKGDNQYNLMPEMNELMEMVASEMPSASKEKKKKKEKKKSKKRRKQASESDDSEEERRAKKKSHSKEKGFHKAHGRRDTSGETVKRSRQDRSRSSDELEQEVEHRSDRRRVSHEDDSRSNKVNKSDKRRSSSGEHFSRHDRHHLKDLKHRRRSSSDASDSSSSRDSPRKKHKSDSKKKSGGHEKHSHDSKTSQGSHRKLQRRSSSEETSDSDENRKKERRKSSHKEEDGRRRREKSSPGERSPKKVNRNEYRKRHHNER